MFKSMTGFGRAEIPNGNHIFKTEIRSVNNRFIEVKIRLPKNLAELEFVIKKQLRARCARGSFEVSVTLDRNDEGTGELEIRPNLPLASQYVSAMTEIKNFLGLKGEIDVNSILQLRDVMKAEPLSLDPAREDLVIQSVNQAITELIKMREEEGNHLQADIFQRLDEVEQQAALIKPRQPLMLRQYQEKLKERVQLLAEGVDLDPARLAQETAIMADRCDVTEELTRLASHIKQFRQLAEADEPVGRKLEFLIQEFNREANTIGSKTLDGETSRCVIEIKSILEKIREQLANIE